MGFGHPTETPLHVLQCSHQIWLCTCRDEQPLTFKAQPAYALDKRLSLPGVLPVTDLKGIFVSRNFIRYVLMTIAQVWFWRCFQPLLLMVPTVGYLSHGFYKLPMQIAMSVDQVFADVRGFLILALISRVHFHEETGVFNNSPPFLWWRISLLTSSFAVVGSTLHNSDVIAFKWSSKLN